MQRGPVILQRKRKMLGIVGYCWERIWLVVWNIWNIFPYIGFLVMPIDLIIFFRGVETTNQRQIFDPWVHFTAAFQVQRVPSRKLSKFSSCHLRLPYEDISVYLPSSSLKVNTFDCTGSTICCKPGLIAVDDWHAKVLQVLTRRLPNKTPINLIKSQFSFIFHETSSSHFLALHHPSWHFSGLLVLIPRWDLSL